MEKNDEIDWEDYWFGDSRTRTQEEIKIAEEKVKAKFRQEAELSLNKNPNKKKTVDKLVKQRWEKYNSPDLQKRRGKEYRELNIDLLFYEVFNELMHLSGLDIKSSKEKEEFAYSVFTKFRERIIEQIGESDNRIPTVTFPLDSPEGMRDLVRKMLCDIEPRLKCENKEVSNELDQKKSPQMRMTKTKIFTEFKSIPDIMKKLPEKERRGAQIWKLSQGMVWNKFSDRYKDIISEPTLKRYLTEFRSKLDK